jgi:error-prone DNA polymerase
MHRLHALPALATGDVLYDTPDRRMLQDVVTAIREKCTIDELGFRRERSADRHLKSPEEMARRFARYPEALAATEAIAERCTFSLRELKELSLSRRVVIMADPQQALAQLTAWTRLKRKFRGPSQAYRTCSARARLVESWLRALFPHRERDRRRVRAQRRGNPLPGARLGRQFMLICFVLGITSIDPVKHELLFERFVSTERASRPISTSISSMSGARK